MRRCGTQSRRHSVKQFFMQKEADIRLWGDVFAYLLQDNKNGNVKDSHSRLLSYSLTGLPVLPHPG